MNAFLSLGRWFFAIPFAIFGLQHLMNANSMTAYIPAYMPVPIVWVYLTGLCLIAASVSMLTGKYDKLGATLLAIFLLLMVATMHLPNTLNTGNGSMPMIMLLKDLIAAGGAMMFAQHYATDRSIIG
jgi:putative oxidoreductase